MPSEARDGVGAPGQAAAQTCVVGGRRRRHSAHIARPPGRHDRAPVQIRDSQPGTHVDASSVDSVWPTFAAVVSAHHPDTCGVITASEILWIIRHSPGVPGAFSKVRRKPYICARYRALLTMRDQFSKFLGSLRVRASYCVDCLLAKRIAAIAASTRLHSGRALHRSLTRFQTS